MALNKVKIRQRTVKYCINFKKNKFTIFHI